MSLLDRINKKGGGGGKRPEDGGGGDGRREERSRNQAVANRDRGRNTRGTDYADLKVTYPEQTAL